MEKIGLQAVMEMAGFTQGINKYNQMIGGATSNTTKGAGIMTKALAGIGTAMKVAGAMVVGGATAIAGAMTASLVATNKWAETLDGIGDVLGTTSEQSAALAVAAKSIGAPIDQVTNSMAILTRGLFDAKGEIGPTGLVLQQLGVSFQDANGKILPTTDILQQVADKIAVMPDGLAKTQLQMDLFGKSGKDVGDLMGILADGGMERMNQKAKDLGLSMGEDAVAGAIGMGRSMNDLKMAGEGLLVMIGTALLPVVQPLIDLFLKGAGIVTELVRAISSGEDPLFALTEAFSKLFGVDAATKFNGIAKAVVQVATDIRDWLEPKLIVIKDFIITDLVPAFESIVLWLATNIPEAITALKDEWEKLKEKWQDFKTYIEEKLGPALDDITDKLGLDSPEAVGKATTAFDTFRKDPLHWLIEDVKGLGEVFEALSGWIGRKLPEDLQSSKPGWEGLKESFEKIWAVVRDQLVGPDGYLTKLHDWFDRAKIAIGLFVTSEPVQALIQAFVDIYNAVKNVVDEVVILIEKLIWLGNIKIPNIFGSKGRIEIGLEGIARGFANAIKGAKEFEYALGGINGLNVGGLTSFAGAIMGRFKDKFTTPLEDRVKGLRETLDALNEAYADDNTTMEQRMAMDLERIRLEKELAETSEELNIQKTRELELQKQLNDLAFLQAQMSFMAFLTENELNLADILGDLQLGLDLDLPAFMDAITRALAALVANLNLGVSGEGLPLPTDPAGFRGGGGTNQVYNSKTVIINMNGAINNGMDMASMKAEVLSWVTEAIGA